MNRIQLVGQFSKAKQRLLLAGKSNWVDLLFPPSINAFADIQDGQHVQLAGDIWSHPEKENSCVVRVALIDLFPGDNKSWASGRLTLSNCRWIHAESFLKPSVVHGTTDGRDSIFITMPLMESRWHKKVGGIIRPHGHVDFEVAFGGASKLQCVAIINDETSADGEAKKPLVIGGCAPLEWHDKSIKRAVRRRNRESISAKLRRAVFLRDGFKCQECGAFPSEQKDVFLEVDHVIPVANGGSNNINNLQTLCSVCNAGKGTDPAAPTCTVPGHMKQACAEAKVAWEVTS